MSKQLKTTLLSILVLGVIAFAITQIMRTNGRSNQMTPPPTPPPAAQPNSSSIPQPLDMADKRITKKPFGIHVTTQNSPVNPERFTGYHTGTDFEALPQEAEATVNFYAICAGKILRKETARGYGGMLVTSCTIDNQPVTVVYGHISLASVSKKIGDEVTAAELIGRLGQPPSETDGERKHLHLGIHKGTAVDTRGYVATSGELNGWIDFQTLK